MGDTFWTYPALVHRVVDADTIRLELDLGLRTYRVENCRIINVNAPEVSTQAGRDAKAWAAKLLLPDTVVSFVSRQLDKYGRPLGTLALPNGADYGQTLMSYGYAEPFGEGKA